MTEQSPNMMTYIKEEHEVLGKMLQEYPDNCPVIEGTNWLLLATGSSINAAYSAKYYIEKILPDVFISIEEPFKFQYYEKLCPQTDTLIGISQSGESTSTIEAIRDIRQKNAQLKIYALTSKLDSEVTKLVDDVIDIENGIERVGYVTKGFSATIFKLMLTGLHTARIRNLISSEEEKQELNSFQKAIDKIPQIIQKTEDFFENWSSELLNGKRFTTLCCGSAIGTAMEMQTKFAETVRLPSQGMDIEVFMHGPYFEVNAHHQHFYIDSYSPMKERLYRLREYETQYVGQVFTIDLHENHDRRAIGLALEIDEYKAPLFLIIPFQILAHHIAEAHGNNLPHRIYTDFGIAMKSKTKPGDYDNH